MEETKSFVECGGILPYSQQCGVWGRRITVSGPLVQQSQCGPAMIQSETPASETRRQTRSFQAYVLAALSLSSD